MSSAIRLILEDETPLRTIFDKHDSLKTLIVNEKMNNLLAPTKYEKSDKKMILNPNSFEHFRDRFYQEFYDFYDMTILLE